MDPSSALHHQEMSSQTLESMLVCTKAQQDDQKKPRPQPEAALKCPRCDSTNTKFCYYNNYSLTQPRYFCKSCRRYWTKGGTLRNVPVGGGCRKNKRSSSSSSRKSQDQPLTSNPSHLISSLPSFSYDSSDLSLAFARLVHKQQNGHLGYDNNTHCDAQSSGTSTPALFDALRGGFMEPPNGFHNFYYNGNMGHLENGAVNHIDQEMAMPYDQDHMSGGATTTATAVTVTTMKQEYGNGREGEGRVLWGFPWQIGGEGNNVGDVDHSGRESWNGLGSSWHGLLNSPLM